MTARGSAPLRCSPTLRTLRTLRLQGAPGGTGHGRGPGPAAHPAGHPALGPQAGVSWLRWALFLAPGCLCLPACVPVCLPAFASSVAFSQTFDAEQRQCPHLPPAGPPTPLTPHPTPHKHTHAGCPAGTCCSRPTAAPACPTWASPRPWARACAPPPGSAGCMLRQSSSWGRGVGCPPTCTASACCWCRC